MVRRLLPLCALLALFCVGCVPVTEPVGDVTTAEADNGLVGTWANKNQKDKGVLRIDAPEVKGNPKGLMRMAFLEDKKGEALWFFVATVGKEKYGNILADTDPTKKG